MSPAGASSGIARALSIAGSDSGGGAGIQADLKTFSAFGVYGMSVITALTAQNSVGVQAVQASTPEFVRAQFQSVVDDFGVDALKTGMLGDIAMVEAVSSMIAEAGLGRLVVDPVMIAKSGAALLDQDAVGALRTRLLPLALVVTPNLPEAEALVGGSIRSAEDMAAAARRIHQLGPRWVLLKGGHAEGDEVVDLLFDGERFDSLRSERIQTPHTHGTGCTFAAAITAALARGHTVREAFALAKHYVSEAIRSNPGLGAGHGPLNHLLPGFRGSW